MPSVDAKSDSNRDHGYMRKYDKDLEEQKLTDHRKYENVEEQKDTDHIDIPEDKSPRKYESKEERVKNSRVEHWDEEKDKEQDVIVGKLPDESYKGSKPVAVKEQDVIVGKLPDESYKGLKPVAVTEPTKSEERKLEEHDDRRPTDEAKEVRDDSDGEKQIQEEKTRLGGQMEIPDAAGRFPVKERSKEEDDDDKERREKEGHVPTMEIPTEERERSEKEDGSRHSETEKKETTDSGDDDKSDNEPLTRESNYSLQQEEVTTSTGLKRTPADLSDSSEKHPEKTETPSKQASDDHDQQLYQQQREDAKKFKSIDQNGPSKNPPRPLHGGTEDGSKEETEEAAAVDAGRGTTETAVRRETKEGGDGEDSGRVKLTQESEKEVPTPRDAVANKVNANMELDPITGSQDVVQGVGSPPRPLRRETVEAEKSEEAVVDVGSETTETKTNGDGGGDDDRLKLEQGQIKGSEVSSPNEALTNKGNVNMEQIKTPPETVDDGLKAKNPVDVPVVQAEASGGALLGDVQQQTAAPVDTNQFKVENIGRVSATVMEKTATDGTAPREVLIGTKNKVQLTMAPLVETKHQSKAENVEKTEIENKKIVAKKLADTASGENRVPSQAAPAQQPMPVTVSAAVRQELKGSIILITYRPPYYA